ncbi:MAG: HYR domain-containing protein [Polyangiaceae bacterium]
MGQACAHVGFNGSGSASPDAGGGADGGLAGDDVVLPVAIPGGYDREWNRWHFSLPADYDYVDLTFFTGADEDNIGHLFAVRIDGQLVYSGRAGVDHDADTLVELKNLPFHAGDGLHLLEVHMDDQEYANGDNDPDFHCNDYDGPPAFVDALAFHNDLDAPCGDVTPPTITCPPALTQECSTLGGVPAGDPAMVSFLGGAVATDNVDPAPAITHDAPPFFTTGTTTVTFTATDAAGNAASCQSTITVVDTQPPLLGAFALTPSKLAPPNHKLRDIAVPTLAATDVCDAAPIIVCSVGSNEPPNGVGDGNTPFDIVFDGDEIFTQSTGVREIATVGGAGTFDLELRSERAGPGKGRVYTTTCSAVDAHDNQSVSQVSTVTVK